MPAPESGPVDASPADALPADRFLDEDWPIDELDEEFFRAQVAKIMAEARRVASGGDPSFPLGGWSCVG